MHVCDACDTATNVTVTIFSLYHRQIDCMTLSLAFSFSPWLFFGYRSFAMHFGDGMLSAARIQLKALFPPSIEFRQEMLKRSRLQTIRAEHDISLMWERCICDRETENNEHEIIVSV